MECVQQTTTLEDGNGYDVPVPGNKLIVDYWVWDGDENRHDNDYKGELITTVNDAQLTVVEENSGILNECVKCMTLGEKVRLRLRKGQVIEVKLKSILEYP